MIFRFDTRMTQTRAETKRAKTKRLSKDVREALEHKVSLTAPAVSTVSIATLSAVTVYPY